MKKVINKSILSLLILFSIVFCGIFAQSFSNGKSAAALEQMSDLKISSATNVIIPGGELTLDITLSSKRTGTRWAAIDLCIGILKEDGTGFDADLAKYVDFKFDADGCEIIELGNELRPYSEMLVNDLTTEGYFRYLLTSVGDERSTASETALNIHIPIVIKEGFTASRLIFGLKPSVSDVVSFGIGASDAKDTPTGKRADGVLGSNILIIGQKTDNTTSYLKFSSADTSFVPGGEITLDLTLSSKRTGTRWAAIDLCIGILKEDGTGFDADLAKYVDFKFDADGCEIIELGNELRPYSEMLVNDLTTEGYFRYLLTSVGDERSTASETALNIHIPIVIKEGFTASRLIFGLKPSVSDVVTFGIGGSDARDNPTGKGADGILGSNMLIIGQGN